MSNTKVAIVTGATRGLGLGCAHELVAQNYEVICTGRDTSKIRDQFKDAPVRFFDLDVTKATQVESFAKFLTQEKRIDVLINNAGVFMESMGNADTLSTSPDTVLKTFEANTLGAYRLCQVLVPIMKKQGHGRIVNVSSGMGELADMGPGYPAYRISKTALNAVTKVIAEDLKGTDILVNAVCPGWVKTDMGGAGATRELDEGVRSILWAALLPKGGPSGGFYRDGQPLAW